MAVLAASASSEELPLRHKQWLEEEVLYIITPLEKDVFLKLKTDRERDLFIGAFWKQRDPTPSMPENGFKTEHYRRIQYANHFFGREAPKPGWRTDRGRIYIILGEPNDIQRFEGETQVYPTEIWFYQNKAELGLPAGFNLVFFRQGGSGEYKLYSPTRDGPQALLTSYMGDPVDYLSAYRTLRELQPELASVSLSLVPGEQSSAFGRPSLASDLLIQQVESTPRRMIKEKYAQKFLDYKDIVEVEYTANYINSDSLVKVTRDPSGLHLVHLAIEPERLSVNQYETKYYTTLKLNANIATLEGKTIFQFERDVAVELDEEKMASASRQPLNLLDVFPLIPGNFRLSVLLKNEVSKEFTSLECTLSIPEAVGLEMTSPLLAHKVISPETNQANIRPFRLGLHQFYCQPNRAFLKSDTLTVACQIHGLSRELLPQAEIRYDFLKNDEMFRSFSRKMSEHKELPDVAEEFPLAEFPAAHYRLRVTLLLDGREVLSESDEFDITHLEVINRPWFHSRIFPPSSDPVYDYLVGTQYFNAGRFEEAIPRLEKAWRSRPDSPDIAQNLAQAYMARGEYQKVEPVLASFASEGKPAKYEIYFLLGRAYQRNREFDKAIGVFGLAISHYGTNMNVLNAVGDCHFQKGDAQAALAVWEKSLAINPDQPQIRKAVEALKGKDEKK